MLSTCYRFEIYRRSGVGPLLRTWKRFGNTGQLLTKLCGVRLGGRKRISVYRPSPEVDIRLSSNRFPEFVRLKNGTASGDALWTHDSLLEYGSLFDLKYKMTAERFVNTEIREDTACWSSTAILPGNGKPEAIEASFTDSWKLDTWRSDGRHVIYALMSYKGPLDARQRIAINPIGRHHLIALATSIIGINANYDEREYGYYERHPITGYIDPKWRDMLGILGFALAVALAMAGFWLIKSAGLVEDINTTNAFKVLVGIILILVAFLAVHASLDIITFGAVFREHLA